jgi:pentatricopeptide repeat protein
MLMGRNHCIKDAESAYLELLENRCIPTKDTYALLLKAYCKSGLLEKAKVVCAEMQKIGLPPSLSLYQLMAIYILRELCYKLSTTLRID